MNSRRIPPLSRVGLALLLVLCLGASCTATRPVVKIGLVAPFEGLYRRSGYEALDAMRMAVAKSPAARVDIIPLAVDGGDDPVRTQRAIQKILADPAVRAVIGPLDPGLAAAASAIVSGTGVLWLSPLHVAAEGGLAAPPAADDGFWATELVRTVAAAARAHGAQRLILAGHMAGWPDLTADQWSAVAGLPVQIASEADLARPTDDDEEVAILHLGPADVAAATLRRLRASGSRASFWLGPAGGDPVFFEQAALAETVHWAIWSDREYNAWAQSHAPATPAAYLIYLATRQALSAVARTPADREGVPWQVSLFALGADGVSRPVEQE